MSEQATGEVAGDPRRHPRLCAPGHLPSVSVVMAILDEEAHLEEAVRRVFAQDYPGDFEVVLALGPSKDRTSAIAESLAADEPRLRLVHNPTGATPAGLNAAIGAASGQVVVRVDGHGLLSDGYITTAVRLLDDTDADNVGGLMAAEGKSPFELAVARAMTSRIGIGGQSFHVGGGAGAVDSVYLGVFRRETLTAMGGYDETFRRAQDWELNYRIREEGGTVWFSPELRVAYRPRSSWPSLARQFYQTGQWRRVVARLHPGTADTRYLAPPVTLVAIAAGTACGLVGVVTARRWLLAGFVLPAGYLGGVLAGSAVVSRGLPPRARAWLPVVVATMHLWWGAGFLSSPKGLVDGARSGERAERAA
jgi:succinoglycan biosynthesis protein ExoA